MKTYYWKIKDGKMPLFDDILNGNLPNSEEFKKKIQDTIDSIFYSKFVNHVNNGFSFDHLHVNDGPCGEIYFTPPHCAVCHKRVARFEQTYDLSRHVTIFTAECHGEIEVVELPDDFINNLGGPNKLETAEAFANHNQLKRIEEKK